ncbi:MAG: hypothetical protein K2W85_10390 [Phycisphaerales bacterium]|nr:hypothetical protein [Phycisphaerales bacterium]
MKSSSTVDWSLVRSRAATFPEEAFEFVRDGLRHTVETVHADMQRRAGGERGIGNTLGDLAEHGDDQRHVSGQQLCLGLRDLALQRYGLLAHTVLTRWGVRKTEDFGVIVYAMIDRKELRAGDRDCYDDFKSVYDFAEAFDGVTIG